MIKLTHNTTIWLGGSLGITLTIAVAISTFQYMNQTTIQQFQEQARHTQQQLANQLGKAKDNLNYIATAFYINPQESQSRVYHNYTLLYAPIVRHSSRLEFEKEQQEDGYITFQIHNGERKSAPQPDYLPITHIDPFTVKHAKSLGLDLLNKPETRKAILLAARTGKLAISMLGLSGEKSETWLIKPIYSGLAGPSDPYFATHQMEMLNAIVALHIPLEALLKSSDISPNIDAKLSLTVNEKNKPFNWQLSSSGLKLSQEFSFLIDSQHHLRLSIQQLLPWSQQQVWLVFIITFIGLSITILLIRTSLSVIRSEQYKDNILQSTSEGILSFDEFGGIIEMNPAAQATLQLMGLNSKQSIQQLFNFPQIDSHHSQSFAKQLLDQPETLLNQVIELHSTGPISYTIEGSISLLETLTNTQFIMFFRNITQRKNNEAERVRLATIVAQSFNAIIVTDRQGTITYVNASFEKLSGFSADEAIGENPSIVKSQHHPDSYYKKMWAQLTAGKSWSGNFINLAKDGHFYEVEQTIFPIFSTSNHEHVGYTAIQQDITERKHLQKQDEHAQRLESLGVLAGGIAHDFNNLLTAIMGNASLAKGAIKQPERYNRYLNNITHASESAANLCTQMLAYSGKGQFIIHPINLSDMIEKTMQLLEASVPKRIQLNLNLNKALPLINADTAQMQQIIMNLVLNASEAIGDQNGNIDVTTTTVSLHQADLLKLLNGNDMKEGQYIALHVKDDGCGMDGDTQKKIFDPFFTTKFTGRGLGMSAILGIIHGHHGGLRLDSEPQKGTLFSVYIPIGQQQSIPAHEPIHISQPATSPSTILIVDDDDGIRELASCVLEDSGFSSYLAYDGEHGLKQLKKHLNEIDLVLLDMTMPILDGYAFHQQMQAFAPHIPVIIASGYSEEDIREQFKHQLQGSQPGKINFLQKPYLPEQLIQTVQKMLTSSTRTTDDS